MERFGISSKKSTRRTTIKLWDGKEKGRVAEEISAARPFVAGKYVVEERNVENIGSLGLALSISQTHGFSGVRVSLLQLVRGTI